MISKKDVELRKLPAASLCSIASILEIDDGWKKVMSLIPKNPRSEYFKPKYNNEHIKQIEDHARMTNRKCAEILFEEWGTSGRIRPTLGTLREVVQKAENYRAADNIAEMLQEALPERPRNGPAASIDTNITLLEQSMTGNNYTTVQVRSMNRYATTAEVVDREIDVNVPNFTELGIKTGSTIAMMAGNTHENNYQTSLPQCLPTDSNINNGTVDTEILKDEKLFVFEYNILEKITKKFAEMLIFTPDKVQNQLAGKIGSGGFGDVYVGFHSQYGHLAIKKARTNLNLERKPEIAMKVFNAEVKFLSQFRHKNIVPIIGYSIDGPATCIVCEYIDGGNLEKKVAERMLTEIQRINIMIGTAEGLKYLHQGEKPDLDDPNMIYNAVDSMSKKNNFVHGDVKTANILLTRDLVPKLCDFGLGKQYDSTCITTKVMGTSAYMAPEGFHGTITQKIDIYSFGIVLLELLTGLKALHVNHNKETVNINDYVEEACPNGDITKCLDPFIAWTKAKEIYSLARNCLERQRKQRPTSDEICETLFKIQGT